MATITELKGSEPAAMRAMYGLRPTASDAELEAAMRAVNAVYGGRPTESETQAAITALDTVARASGPNATFARGIAAAAASNERRQLVASAEARGRASAPRPVAAAVTPRPVPTPAASTGRVDHRVPFPQGNPGAQSPPGVYASTDGGLDPTLLSAYEREVLVNRGMLPESERGMPFSGIPMCGEGDHVSPGTAA